MGYFIDEKISEDERRNAAFKTICAVREAVSLAKDNHYMITYETTLDYLRDINLEVYEEIVSVITGGNESNDVKYFKDKADLLSSERNKVMASDLIQKEIQEHENLLAISRKSSVANRLLRLRIAKEYFTPKELSEHKILEHDFSIANRSDFFQKDLYQNVNYRDYKLWGGRILRLRLAPPLAPLGVGYAYAWLRK